MRRKYRAFISYSHADEVWGRKLHRTLERYFTPRALVGTESRDGPVPKRIFPIFRDREELPTSSDLGGVINQALEDSDYLIVICSPRSAKSKWVNEEILTYKRLGRSNRVMCLIVDGEPNGSDVQGKEPLECFPEAVRFVIGEDGDLTAAHTEPIAADAREGKDGWRNAWMKLAAGVLGVDFDALKQRELSRRRRRAALWTAAAACIVGVAVFGVWKERQARIAEQREAARVFAMKAHDALDRRDERAALAAVSAAFPASPDFSKPDPLIPPEAMAALTRAAFETRLLADYPAPAGPDVEAMRLLPEGALATVEAGGRTHLMDPATGEATTVYDPQRWTHTRISEDGKTLWTAHFEPERQDEDGEWFAPLLFEEAELATGEVRLATAVKSVAAYGGDASISPDGAHFAVDLGPGEGEETIIAVFRREEQALAGVLALPGDRAGVRFVGPDRILAQLDAPSPWEGAPGLYLWRITEERPVTLREPGAPPVCDVGDDPAETRGVEVSVSPDMTEVALYVGGGEKSCFHRWSLADGRPLATARANDGGEWGRALGPGGPYVFGTPYGAARLLPDAEAKAPNALWGCGEGLLRHLPHSSGRNGLFCADRDERALYFGPGGGIGWIGAAQPGGVRAVAFDQTRGRLFTLGADARLRIWDARPRSGAVSRVRELARMIPGPDGRIALLTENRHVRLLDGTDATPPGPVIEQPAPGGLNLAPLAGGALGFFTFTAPGFNQSDGDGEANRLTIIDGTSGETLSAYDGLRSSGGNQPQISSDGARFLIVKADGGAVWGEGATGRSLAEIDLGPDQPIFSGAVAGSRYGLIGSNGEWENPEARIMRLLVGGDVEAPRVVREWKAQHAELALSADGTRALTQISRVPPLRTTLSLVDIASGEETALAEADYAASWFGFSPSGDHVHYAPPSGAEAKRPDGATITGPVIFDGKNGQIAFSAPPFDFLSDAPQWSPSGRYLVHNGAPLKIIEAATGDEVCSGLAAETARAVVFSPMETRIAFQTDDLDASAGVTVVDMESCAVIRRIAADTGHLTPHFPGENRIWLPLDAEIAEAPLTIVPAKALASVRRRAARLARE